MYMEQRRLNTIGMPEAVANIAKTSCLGIKQYGLSVILILFTVLYVQAQSPDSLRLVNLKSKLDRAVYVDSSYAEKIDVSVASISLTDFLKNIAKAGNLNINVNFDRPKAIACNFKQVSIVDILFFICKEHYLEVEWVGDILSVYPYMAPIEKPLLDISYNSAEQTLSFSFSQVRLEDVAKKISQESGYNLIIPQNLFNHPVSAFGNAMKIDDAIQTLAAVNSLSANRSSSNIWTIQQGSGGEAPARTSFFSLNELEVDSLGLITAKISRGNVRNIVPELCERLGFNYFFTENIDHTTGIYVDKVGFEAFLKVLFTGTDISWRVDNGIYIFGKTDDTNRLSIVKVVPMKYRAVDKVFDIIPAELKAGMEVITFPDLNSLIISGNQQNAMQILSFLNDIDKSVPLISIDVIIVDATDKNTQEVGVTMGVGTEPTASSGTISPGIDVSLGATSINRLINSFNGFGSINLGKVSPNFFLDLKFLEESGKIILRSTPRLSTLNGHKATLKSGETVYYKENQINIIGTQNPMQSESYIWKSVEANFTLDITPYISLDSCITLQIDLIQNEFTERAASEKDAPPGMTTRSFNSIITVKNQEMVLLGGIERSLSSRTSRGLPFIARIPVLRWIFGTSSKIQSVQKLNVFIKPTVIE